VVSWNSGFGEWWYSSWYSEIAVASWSVTSVVDQNSAGVVVAVVAAAVVAYTSDIVGIASRARCGLWSSSALRPTGETEKH
jgi:hypothetical protein